MIESYPLQWPLGYARTERILRKDSRFEQSPQSVQDAIRREIKLLGATDLIISSNANLKKDGFMYSEMMKDRLPDPGVAIYFTYRKKQTCLCCDHYVRIWENLYALARAIEALRTIARDHVSDFLDRTFTGFSALPPAAHAIGENYWSVLGFPSRPDDKELVKAAYKVKAKKVHPDAEGGDKLAFQILTEAYDKALKTYE